jgi:hypothetical protein
LAGAGVQDDRAGLGDRHCAPGDRPVEPVLAAATISAEPLGTLARTFLRKSKP